jgi:hypothetical protein
MINSRVIKDSNLKDVTWNFISSKEWDFIILNKTINVDNLRNWYKEVSTNLDYLKFNFQTCTKYIKDSENGYFITDSKNYQWKRKPYYEGLQNSWALTWPIERDVPLPPPWAANLTYFNELTEYFNKNGENIKDFDYSKNLYLTQYLFGEWEKISKKMEKYIFNPRITEHMPGHIIEPHVDGFIARLHIPITDDNSKFYWGDTWDREYKFEPGKIYIINPKVTHSTTNFGPVNRANIIADLYKEMGKLSEEVMKCKEPPNLTVFE